MTVRASSRLAPAALAAALVGAGGAAATLLARLDLAEIVEASHLVVVGTVASQQSRWDGGSIVTVSTIDVERTVKASGEEPGTVAVTTLGGEVGDVGLWVPGESSFEVGARYLVFARRTKDGSTLRVTGMAQGCLRIVTDAEGREWAIPPQAAGLVKKMDGHLVPAAPFLEKPVLLEDLLERIRAIEEEPP